MDKGYAAGLLREAYDKLKASDASAALALLEQALSVDYLNDEIKYALKCVHWWIDQTSRIDEIKNPYEKGAFLMSQLKQYYIFLAAINNGPENTSNIFFSEQPKYDQCQYAIRYYVYSKALFFFNTLLKNPSNHNDPGLLLFTGRCYKGLGDYDAGRNYLEQAVSISKEDPQILAELADVNAMLTQTKDAKALFREAFFIDPSRIDLKFLESALIVKVCQKVSELGYKDDELCEWIPVYGFLWKVFTVKRELKQMEVARLKQSIFSMEAEYDSNPARRILIKPRLLNHYFRLIDYYEIIHEESSLIEETLLKIKVKDPEIFEMYTS